VKESVKYIMQLLNISTDSELVVSDLTVELSNIDDLGKFMVYVRSNFNGANMGFKNGLQKFHVLLEDYKKLSSRLNEKQITQVSNFSEKLYKKTCDIFDQINWEIQAEGRDLAKYDIPAMFEPEELKVLVKVGKRDRLIYLARHDKHELEDRIFAVVRDLTVMKVSSTKAIKEDGSDTLKRLENGKR